MVLDAPKILRRARVYHNDVKLNNIFVCHSETGSILFKLGDFGVSRYVDDEDDTATYNTFGYKSPLQLINQHDENADQWGALISYLIAISPVKRKWHHDIMNEFTQAARNPLEYIHFVLDFVKERINHELTSPEIKESIFEILIEAVVSFNTKIKGRSLTIDSESK